MSEAMIVRKGGGGSGRLQEKTVSPSVTLQEVTPSEGYDGLSKVNVEAISPTKAAQTYTPGLEPQTIQSGQWLTGDQTIAAISPTKGAETFTPGLTAQTIQAGRWLTGDQTIAAISPTKGAETYTPGVAAQTIQADRWLTGDQTIAGDANLLAANIKKGISIFGVSGSYEAVLDTNNAILKVVTSTGCSVNVSNVADGGSYNLTQLDSEGFVRSGDANVTEHFFIIPLAEFGDFTVKSTHPTYGDNEKQNPVTIGYAGRMYEVLCGGKNIILDRTFGLQEGFSIGSMYYTYDSRDKRIEGPTTQSVVSAPLSPAISVAPYELLTVSLSSRYLEYENKKAIVTLREYVDSHDGYTLASIETPKDNVVRLTANITNKVYPEARIIIGGYTRYVTEIMLT